MRRKAWRLCVLSTAVSVMLIGSACDDVVGLCGNTVVTRIPSPDRRREAVVFARDCGATTAVSTHLSILKNGAQPSGAASTFVADSNHGAAPSDSHDVLDLRVSWKSPTEIQVTYPSGARLFLKKSNTDGIGISYVTR
jgi:hypothetical protein